MALITCPECGRKISTKADFCPQCGWKPSLLYQEKSPATPSETPHHGSPAATNNSERFNLKKINTLTVLKIIIVALAIIAAIVFFKNHSGNGNHNTPDNAPTSNIEDSESKQGNGWQYDINESNGEVVASIVADDSTITMKYMASNANSILMVMNTSKVPNFKDNKLLGISFDNVNHLCEVQRDQDAGSPTYRVALNAELIEKFKTIPKFSLIFDDEEITFSSSQALNIPSAESLQPSNEITTKQRQQQSGQQGPTQQHRESRSNRNNEEWEDIYESPGDQVFADPTLIENHPKQTRNADVPTRTRPTAESDHQKTDDARPTNELLQKEKEEHRRQILVVSNEDN